MRSALTEYEPGESANMKIWESCLYLQEGNVIDGNDYCKKAMNLCFYSWVSSPDVPSSCHIPILQSFQQIIELYESSKLIQEISPPNTPNQSRGTYYKYSYKEKNFTILIVPGSIASLTNGMILSIGTICYNGEFMYLS